MNAAARSTYLNEPGLAVLGKRLADIAVVLAAAFLAAELVYREGGHSPHLREAVLAAMVAMLLLWEQTGLYLATRSTRLLAEVEVLSAGWLAGLAVATAYEWYRDRLDGPELQFLAFWLMAGWMSAVGLRVVARAVMGALRRRGYNLRRVVIAVASDLGQQVARQLQERPDAGIEVVGFFDDRDPERVRSADGPPVLGRIDTMAEYAAQHHVDEVWIALPFRAEDRVRDILAAMRHSTADVCLVPDVFQFFVLNQSLGQVAGMPLLALNATPLNGVNRLVKAIEDRVLAALILLLASPVMLAVAIAIRLDSPGPVLFRQRRHGLHDEPIEMFKFRTMRPHVQPPGTYTLATRGDKRVTAVGAYLRRTSLDELPQFFNVLRGEMSIVGPRPYPVEINNEYKDVVDRYMLRHKVKPGITGWAQVNGLRGALDSPDKMERRVMHDLYYIEHWSLWFDLKIIGLTVLRGFTHENAY